MQPQQLPTPLGAPTPPQPQQPQQQPTPNPYPVDYLDQISQPVKQPGVSNRLIFILIGIAVLVIGIVGFLMLSSNPKTADLEAMATKLTGLQTIASDAQKNIKNSNLRSVNSSLVLYITNTNRDLEKVLERNNIKLNKKDTDESVTKMETTLEEARITDNFDKTYADEMKDQLSRINIYMNSAYEKTNDKADKTFLEAAAKDLDSFYTQLSDFSTPSS